jgi:hypothetical protein
MTGYAPSYSSADLGDKEIQPRRKLQTQRRWRCSTTQNLNSKTTFDLHGRITASASTSLHCSGNLARKVLSNVWNVADGVAVG